MNHNQRTERVTTTKISNPSSKKIGTTLVIGAGMAGLLAARVLSEQCDEVLVLERDTLPEQAENRPGTPQSYHPHRLLPPGQMVLEKLFPGFTEELLANGAFLRENRILHLVNPYGTVEIRDDRDAGCSRALLEWVMRGRVQQLGNVRFLGRQEVTGLLVTQDQSAVRGVYLRERGHTGAPTTYEADLVVDASGHTSKLVAWLQSLGFVVPAPERLKVALGYSTRYYKIPSHLTDPVSVILIEGDAHKGMATGAFGAIENNMAQLVLHSAGGASYPATDGARYEEEAAALLSPRIAEELQKLEAIGEPRGFRVQECLRYHFEEMARWPAGLLVIGDAICNFDPVHGQGITVAALEAEILASCVQEQGAYPSPGFEQSVLAKMQEAIAPAWWLTLIADLRWAGVEYEGPVSMEGITFCQAFFDLYLKVVYSGAAGEASRALFEKYFGMAALLLSPHTVVNVAMVQTLLSTQDVDAPCEEALRLRNAANELIGIETARKFGGLLNDEEAQRLDRVLDEVMPHFVQVAVPIPPQPSPV